MAETFRTEWILSSWPFRLGSILYDPIQGMDIRAWDLQDLSDHPGLFTVDLSDLDPRRPDAQRIKGLMKAGLEDQELLRAMYEIQDEDPRLVSAKASNLVAKEVGAWLKNYNLSWNDLDLNNLEGLFNKLEALSPEQHHQFLSDWWETWEIPYQDGKASIFRQEAGPDGSVYASVYGEDAKEVWQTEQATLSLTDFSLWAALRSHWGWRIEFSEHPRPRFQVLEQLAKLFG